MIGKTLGHYQIVEKLGAGGMGIVYKARDTHLDRFVALKILPQDKVADPERKLRFIQEAKAASALNHPNIIHIYDIASEGGSDFIAMEYVAGRTLDRAMGRKGFGMNEALGYAIQIADALAKAHSSGIIHRDLKPANIMVNEDGAIRILDFGLAKLTEKSAGDPFGSTKTEEAGGEVQTEKGAILGTIAYMSPEQAQGKPVDARSDIFSFGSVLYEMLTGQHPFQEESKALTLASILQKEPKPPGEIAGKVPAEIERVLMRCLRKDPQRRWQSMADLRIALQELKEESDSGRLSSVVLAVPRRAAPLRYILPLVVLIGVAAAGLLYWYRPKPSAPGEPAITRLTFDTGLTRYPAISPDGKLVAYASDRGGDGDLDIYVQQVARPQAVRLTQHPANDYQPSFSPDGTQIVFRSDRDGGGVYIIDTLAVGQERRIADHGWHPSFSPDGRQILYTEVIDPVTFPPSRMYLVSPKGGQPTQFQPEFLVSSFAGTGPIACWSPDGKHVFFPGVGVRESERQDWWVAPVDGGPAVATGAADSLLVSPVTVYPMAWFHDRIIFGKGTTIEGFNLYSAGIDPESWQISQTPDRLASGPGIQADPSIADAGSMVFTAAKATAYVWRIPISPGQGTAAGEPERITLDDMGKTQPTVSRDGRKMAYGAYSGTGTGQMQVYLRNLGSGRETSISIQSAGYLFFPVLSADGSDLAYRDIVDNRRIFFLAKGEASVSRKICEDCFVRSFFADPKEAVVQYGNELFRQDLNSGVRSPLLAANTGTIRDADLSPDDRWLAFQIGRPAGGYAIYACPLQGRPVPEPEWILIAEESSYQQSPRWSADGSLIYFISERDGYSCIWAQRLDPSTKKPVGGALAIYHEHRARRWLNRPRNWGSISLIRDALFFANAEFTGNIWMMTLPTR